MQLRGHERDKGRARLLAQAALFVCGSKDLPRVLTKKLRGHALLHIVAAPHCMY